MTTYRSLLANGEFRALFASNALAVAAGTILSLALAASVYAETGSPLLAALMLLGGLLPQAIGALTLLSYADRVPPRGFLALWELARCGSAALMALNVLPVWGVLLLLTGLGAVNAVSGGIRMAVLADIVPSGFVLARSLLNVSVGAMQIAGFAAGGLLIAALGPHRALTVSAVLLGVSGLVTWLGLKARAPKAVGRPGISATWQGNKELFRSSRIRALLLGGWVPNGLIVGAEAMYVPFAGDAASVLFIAAALGMLTGDVCFGRWVSPARLSALVNPLHLLLAVPYLVFFVNPNVWAGAVAVFVASIGFAATLGLQSRLNEAVPEVLRGQAFGLDGSGRMSFQAVGAFAIGSLAEVCGVPWAMTGAALASIAVTLLLWRALRTEPALPQGIGPQRTQEVDPAELGPVAVVEVELGVGALPQKKAR